jgi:ParB family transcriptional regulator, chromosome partitioning protein
MAMFRPAPRLVAVLGPTNTGKTHLAIERTLGHRTSMIGFPLRLLARKKLLPGNQILAIRRVILQRSQRRKKPHRGRGVPRTGKVTAASLIQSYENEAQRQRLLVRRADLAQTRLTFVVNALRLFADEEFLTLLRAEAMHTLPRPLAEQLELSEA